MTNEKYYYSDKPCVNGHTGPRYKSNQTCLQCSKDQAARHRKTDKSKLAVQKYKEVNRDLLNEKNSQYRKDNADKIRAYKDRYYADNKFRYNAWVAKRRATKLDATPIWLTQEQLDNIRALYKQSDAITTETGVRHHVDHIVPLQGQDVCGLHVPWNLQVIPATENLSKHNHMLQ